MFKKGAQQYQQVNVSSEALDADPHRLIQMLLEAALTRLAQVKGAIERNDMPQKAHLLGKVTDIVQTLQSSLNMSSGGEVSLQLERLYDYITFRILEASSQNDEQIIDEVMGLLLQIKSAWDAIRKDYLGANTATMAANNDVAAYAQAY